MTVTITIAGILWTLYAISVVAAIFLHVALSDLGGYPWWGKVGGLFLCLIWPVAFAVFFTGAALYEWLRPS